MCLHHSIYLFFTPIHRDKFYHLQFLSSLHYHTITSSLHQITTLSHHHIIIGTRIKRIVLMKNGFDFGFGFLRKQRIRVTT